MKRPCKLLTFLACGTSLQLLEGKPEHDPRVGQVRIWWDKENKDRSLPLFSHMGLPWSDVKAKKEASDRFCGWTVPEKRSWNKIRTIWCLTWKSCDCDFSNLLLCLLCMVASSNFRRKQVFFEFQCHSHIFEMSFLIIFHTIHSLRPREETRSFVVPLLHNISISFVRTSKCQCVFCKSFRCFWKARPSRHGAMTKPLCLWHCGLVRPPAPRVWLDLTLTGVWVRCSWNRKVLCAHVALHHSSSVHMSLVWWLQADNVTPDKIKEVHKICVNTKHLKVRIFQASLSLIHHLRKWHWRTPPSLGLGGNWGRWS